MKRIAGFLLSFALLFSCAGCAGGGSDLDRLDQEETYDNAPVALAEQFTTLSQLWDAAEQVVVCTVEETECQLPDNFPRTCSTVWVERRLKGQGAERLLVMEEGGRAENGQLVYPAVPPMEKGNRYLLFLVDSALGESWCVAGAFQGKFICREGYCFQQATEETKLTREEYTPMKLDAFAELLEGMA